VVVRRFLISNPRGSAIRALASADGETGDRYLLAWPGNLLVLNLEHWARAPGRPQGCLKEVRDLVRKMSLVHPSRPRTLSSA